MADSHPDINPRDAVVLKMEAEKIDPAIIQTFLYYYDQVASGEKAMIYDRDLEPVGPEDIFHAERLSTYENEGAVSTDRCVRIVLNGGLGTSMGLIGPKSLLKVKNGCSFLEIILAQTVAQKGALCFMNSFNTHRETLSELQRIGAAVEPMTFFQHKFPKIFQSDLSPATWPASPRLEWNPPGHGDIYIALHTSGLLEQLLGRGIRYALISNSDNLGASLDTTLLGFFIKKEFAFMMEVARRLPSDAKGGHLARYRSGRLVLRETAQCPPEEKKAFQDIGHYRYFNTNNIWVDLLQLQTLIEREDVVKLPMILNPKPLDPRNENSPPVFQLESAMGAAISLFEKSTAVCVPRTRFFPVKTCNDLLVLRSDRFVLREDGRLLPNPDSRGDGVRVTLDPAYFKKIDDFDRRFSRGVPSLLDCQSLTVEGNVFFEGHVTINGSVTITNTRREPAVVAEGTVVEEDLAL